MLGAPQNEENLILGAQKNEKFDFFKKREVCDFTEHWGSFPQWVGSICSIPRSWVNSFDVDFALVLASVSITIVMGNRRGLEEK